VRFLPQQRTPEWFRKQYLTRDKIWKEGLLSWRFTFRAPLLCRLSFDSVLTNSNPRHPKLVSRLLSE
jgi:hypothetical protein